MIKRILVPFDGSPSSRSALSIAGSISGIVHAELISLFVEDEARFLDLSLATAIAENVSAQPISGQPLPPDEMLEAEEKIAEERRQLERAVQAICEDTDADAQFVSVRGAPAQVIGHHAKTADLVVMGNSGLHRGQEYIPAGTTIESVLRMTARPVLVVPQEPIGQSTVVIAYDGSRTAERALIAGAELAFICGMTEVHLLTVGFSEEDAFQIQAPALRYLEAYGLQAEGITSSGRAAEAIVAYAEEAEASLLVLGAFGSNRIKELFFGSTTQAVIQKGDIATLLVG